MLECVEIQVARSWPGLCGSGQFTKHQPRHIEQHLAEFGAIKAPGLQPLLGVHPDHHRQQRRRRHVGPALIGARFTREFGRDQLPQVFMEICIDGAPREFLQPCTLREDEVARIEAVGADRAIAFEGLVNLVPEIVAGERDVAPRQRRDLGK